MHACNQICAHTLASYMCSLVTIKCDHGIHIVYCVSQDCSLCVLDHREVCRHSQVESRAHSQTATAICPHQLITLSGILLVRAINLLNLVRHEWRRDVNNANQPSLMDLTLPPHVHVPHSQTPLWCLLPRQHRYFQQHLHGHVVFWAIKERDIY